MIKISIITVVLNGAKTIERAIKSVIDQHYDNVEYIIIDGGSTDGTVDIIKKYESYITYWISEPDDGIYSAMNKGLKHATGKYVNFLNSDDWFEGDVLGKVADYIEITDADVVYGDYNRVLYDGTKIRVDSRPLDYMNVSIPFCHQSVFVRKNLAHDFDESYKIAADYKMLLDFYNDNRTFCYLPYVISNYKSGGVADKGTYNTFEELSIIAAEGLVKSVDRVAVYGPIVLENLIIAEINKKIISGLNHNLIMRYFDERINNVDDGEIVLFGMGELLNKYYKLIERNIKRIRYFVDNDISKEGTYVLGKEVHLPGILRKEEKLSVIILNERYCYEIERQLEDMNLSSSVKVYNYVDLKRDYIKREGTRILGELSQKNECIKTLYEMVRSTRQRL
ncbi:MAG: glycosyltransferase [Lachnospiraceae bacterium]|nr:glycosyltransferase [Lachnospiraceae bacterium]